LRGTVIAGPRLVLGLAIGLVCSLGPVGPVRAQQAIGDFYLFERADPATGEDRSSITTLAEENWVTGRGGLTFQCSDRGMELVVTATYLGRKMSTPVGYAFDGAEPRMASWTVRSSGMAAMAPDEVRDVFVRDAVGETSVVFRLTDFQLRGYSYTFHLGGLERALTRLPCR
jgi:hypothetical protein